MTIDWIKIDHLSSDEFPEDPDKFAEPRLIEALDLLRKTTGHPLYPSPVSGALARYKTGSITSQHYADDTKKSKACDFYSEGTAIEAFLTMVRMSVFNGIGIYLDANGLDGLPWVRIHGDIRDRGFKAGVPLIWIVEKVMDEEKGKMVEKYRYPQKDPEFWALLKDARMYVDRVKQNFNGTSKSN